jgi:hypothetical protein
MRVFVKRDPALLLRVWTERLWTAIGTTAARLNLSADDLTI